LMTGRELTCYLATGNVKSKTIAAKDFRRLRAASFARHGAKRSCVGRWITCGPAGGPGPGNRRHLGDRRSQGPAVTSSVCLWYLAPRKAARCCAIRNRLPAG